MRWLITTTVALSLLMVPGAALAGHGNGNGGGHDGFGLPDQATYGMCTAYENNEQGRENGQAGQAPPFQWLNEQADENDQTVEEYCMENGQHPGQGNGPPDEPGNGGSNGTGGPP